MPWLGFEPRLLRPQRRVLTTIRSRRATTQALMIVLNLCHLTWTDFNYCPTLFLETLLRCSYSLFHWLPLSSSQFWYTMGKQNKIKNQFSSPQIRHVPSGKSVLIPKSPASSPAPRICPLDRPSPAAGSSSRLTDRGPAEGAQRQRLRRPGEGGAKNPSLEPSECSASLYPHLSSRLRPGAPRGHCFCEGRGARRGWGIRHPWRRESHLMYWASWRDRSFSAFVNRKVGGSKPA